MKCIIPIVLVLAVSSAPLARAESLEAKPADSFFEPFHPRKAPSPSGLFLRHGDRLAIIGDSITEQKMYSRYMETYLTVCVPELEVTVRQYGWGGETSWGFLARMTNDCLRFHPTIATTCYGMNDHGYRTYEPSIGEKYRTYSTAIVRAFKAHDVRVVQGSPGCVSKKAPPLNLNLAELRDIGIDIAEQEQVRFADVFWPMLKAGREAIDRYGTNYAIAGGDGIHPGGAGHLVMAYAFLKALGLGGEIGTFTLDLANGEANASAGHKILSAKNGSIEIESRRYPFCAKGDVKRDDSIRSGMSLVPFNHDLNRLMLVVKHAPAAKYKVTWGENSKSYTGEALQAGVNLADDFVLNPFSAAFAKVDEAVAAKQSYETWEVKTMFHGPEMKVEPSAVEALTEKVRTPLAAAIQNSFRPVTHSIRVEAE